MKKKRLERKVFGGGLALLFLLGLGGCGKKDVDVDVNSVASMLLSELTYEDELSEIDLDTARQIYNLDEIFISESRIFVSSGATAEEIAVLKGDTAADADKIKTAMEERVEEQKESFQDYVPEELEKLSKAVIREEGNTVILSISNDSSEAEDLIEKAVK